VVRVTPAGRDAEPESVVLRPRIAARRRKSVVFLEASEVWAFEADARLTYVHSAYGKLDIDVSLAEIESSPIGVSFVRVHRSWLANLTAVKALEHDPGGTQLFVGTGLGELAGIRVPVSRDRVRGVRDALLSSAIGLRRRETADDREDSTRLE
jgi:DNA-binding LytR/AlgR family response regulator